MKYQKIDPAEFDCKIFNQSARQWMLLTAGDFDGGNYNTMTASWGMLGTLWNKPVSMCVVRPQRHTMKFLEEYNTYTLAFLPEKYRSALAECGAVSGAEVDKFERCNLTACGGMSVEAPAIAEAELMIECRQLYRDKLNGKNFLVKKFNNEFYPEKDYHNVIIGEVVAIYRQLHDIE